MDKVVEKGWVQMRNARKSHYVEKGRALCRKWMFLGKIYADDQGTKQLKDDCKTCWKELGRING